MSFSPRQQPGEVDLDVALGIVLVAYVVALQADHLAGQFVDLHRRAHVEHEDVAASGHAAGLQHERHGFGNGHEVAGHLGVGDG